jgi:hypothetical protein
VSRIGFRILPSSPANKCTVKQENVDDTGMKLAGPRTLRRRVIRILLLWVIYGGILRREFSWPAARGVPFTRSVYAPCVSGINVAEAAFPAKSSRHRAAQRLAIQRSLQRKSPAETSGPLVSPAVSFSCCAQFSAFTLWLSFWRGSSSRKTVSRIVSARRSAV